MCRRCAFHHGSGKAAQHADCSVSYQKAAVLRVETDDEFSDRDQEYGGPAHTAGTSADQYLGFVGIPKQIVPSFLGASFPPDQMSGGHEIDIW